MSPLGWAAVIGVVVAAGILLVGYGLAPVYPALGPALRRLDPATARQLVPAGAFTPDVGLDDAEPEPAPAQQWWARLQGRITARLGRIPAISIPSADLNLLERPIENFLLAKVGFAAAGLVVVPVFTWLLGLNGLEFPFAVPALASLAAAAGGFFLPDRDVKVRAGKARMEVRQALCAYLDLAALAKAANYGAVDALSHAAATGQGWAFARIRDALNWAERHQLPPWAGLQRMAEQADIDELADIAAISRTSGDGAAVFATLLARSASLRSALQAEATKTANARGEQMTLPVVALAFGFLALILFAVIARVLGI